MYDFYRDTAIREWLDIGDSTTEAEAADTVSIAVVADAIGIDRRTLRKHLLAAGIKTPRRSYHGGFGVSWTELASWLYRNTDLIRQRAEWGAAIHESRRAKKAKRGGAR